MSRFFGLTFVVCAAACFAAPPDVPLSRAKTALANMPLRFEANRGQFDQSVRYAARAGDYDLLFTARGAQLAIPGSQKIELNLVHSNPQAEIEAMEPLRAHTDYFLGARDQWHTHVPNYGQIRYRGVYRGVDVVYYGGHGQLEYDFVLQPGANPSDIRLQFRGARHLSVTADGDIAFDSPHGRLVQKRPIIYQQVAGSGRREVRGRYVLVARNTVALKLEPYDRSRALTIDPILVYSTYLGGPFTDNIVATKLDAQGRLYVAGSTDHDPNGNDMPATGNTYQGTNGGLTDCFVAILDTKNNYQLLYFSYLGGSNLDAPRAMQIDALGKIYLTGTTNSTNFPTAGNAVRTSGAAVTTWAFVSAIDPDLVNGQSSLFYSTFLGDDSGNSYGNGVDVDGQNNIYVIGTTTAGSFPVTTSAYAGVRFGLQDAFLCAITTSSTNLLYSTYLGAESDDDGRGIAVTPDGKVYFAINTVGKQFPLTGNSYQSNLKGAENIAIGVMDMTKFNGDSLLYSTYFGGSSVDEARKLAFDVNGNLLIVGHSLSSDLPVTGDAVQLNYGGNGDVFVAAVNPNSPQFVQYMTYLGGSHGEVAYDVGTDKAGNIYVTGYTLSSNFPVTPDAPQSHWGNGVDVFLTKLKPHVAGVAGLVYSTFLGGTTLNSGNGLAVTPDGTVYFVGSTGGLWPTTDGALQGFGGGYTDGFISVIK